MRQQVRTFKRKTRPVLKGLIALGWLAALFGVVVCASHYSTTIQRIADRPLVTDLSNSTGLAQVRVWGSEYDSGWRPLPLPSTNLAETFGPEWRNEKNKVQYRFEFKIPENLWQSTEELTFSPNWVVHPQYEVLINNRLVQSGTGMTENGDLIYRKLSVSLPRKLLSSPHVLVEIIATTHPQALGIFHRGKILLGPQVALADLQAETEHAMGSYYLIFLSAKLVAFAIFALFALLTRTLPGFGFFLVFAFFGILENLAIGNFLEGILPFEQRVPLYFCAKAIQTYSLFMFGASLLRLKRKNAINISLLLILVAPTALIWGFGDVSIDFMRHLSNATLLVALAILSGLALLRMVKGGWENLETRYLKLFAASMIYLATLGLILLTTAYQGFDYRPLIDLFFFVFVAYISLSEFASSQARLGIMVRNCHRVFSLMNKFLGPRATRSLVLTRGQLTERSMVVMAVEMKHLRSIIKSEEFDAAHSLIDKLFSDVVESVSQYGGELVSFIADRWIFVWDTEKSVVDTHSRVAQCALAIRKVAKIGSTAQHERSLPLSVSIGVGAGKGHVGIIGSQSSQGRFSIFGSPLDDGLAGLTLCNLHGVDIVASEDFCKHLFGQLVAEKISSDATAPMYKVIGVFVSGGLRIDDPVWESLFGDLTTAILVDDAGSNLRTIDLYDVS